MTARTIMLIVYAIIMISAVWIPSGFSHKNPDDGKSLITVPKWVSKLYLSKRKDNKLIFTLMVTEIWAVLGLVLAISESMGVLPLSFVGPALLIITAINVLLKFTHYAYLFYMKKKQGKS